MISTKNTGGGKSLPKIIQPGNAVCKILSVTLEGVPYDKDAYHVVLHVEGPDLGKDFEGFFLNKDKPELGRHKGQTAKVKSGLSPFSWKTKSGAKIDRDRNISIFIKNLCTALKYDGDIEGETVEAFIENFNKLQPFKDKYLRMCICGREYQNRQGYTNYDLYLPFWSKEGVAYELESVPEAMSKVFKYNPEIHILKKSKPDAIVSFEKPVTQSAKDDFSL